MAALFSGCLEEKCESEVTYKVYEPVFLAEDEFRIDIVPTEARELCHTGGFYVYGSYLLVVEVEKGVHIYNNENPENPFAVAFLPVGGAVGLSVRNDILYVNNYYDLVTFSLENPAAPAMLHRTEAAFPRYGVFNPTGMGNGVIVEYIETDETRTFRCDNSYGGGCFIDQEGLLLVNDCAVNVEQIGFVNAFDMTGGVRRTSAVANESAGGQDQTVGIGGSLARFTIANNTLYVVNEEQLDAFDLSNPAQPQKTGEVVLGWGVETIFPAGNELYIGTNTGMHIMDASDPLNPQLLSTMEHVRACDPVVVSGDRAYVTLRSGTECNGFTNQLEVIDITDKTNPVRLETYPMQGPVGLTVGNDKLFICEPTFGMSIFELDEAGMPTASATFIETLDDARDVIGLHGNRHLITIGDAGVQQLRYTDNNAITQMSELSVCND